MSKNISFWAIVSLILAIVAGYSLYHDNTETPLKETVTVEVIKEVPVEGNSTDTLQTLRDQALSDFLDEVEDTDKYQFCNANNYAFEDIGVAKVYTEYTIQADDEDTNTVTINVKLRYDEESIKACYKNFEASVLYDEDENPVVTIK